MRSRGKRCVVSLLRNALAAHPNSHLSQFFDLLLRQTSRCGTCPALLFTPPAAPTTTWAFALARFHGDLGPRYQIWRTNERKIIQKIPTSGVWRVCVAACTSALAWHGCVRVRRLWADARAESEWPKTRQKVERVSVMRRTEAKTSF